MARKGKKDTKTKDNLFLILNLVLAVVTMALVTALLGGAWAKNQSQMALFLGLTILSQVLFECLLFLVKDKKREKLRALVVGVLYIIAMVFAYLISKNTFFLFLSIAVVLFAMAVNQILLIEKEETKKGKITNILIAIVFILLIVVVFINMNKDDDIYLITLLVGVVFLFGSLKKILFPTLKLEKIKLLLDILVKTHTIDVLVCLLAFMIAFSFAFPIFEENIKTFWDAMWYCFTVITTIGFGDFVATSLVGRILTVILGIYGIVVVAIITSVIVNFYNEVTSKERARDFIE